MAPGSVSNPSSRVAATRLRPPDSELVPLIRAFSVGNDTQDFGRRLVEVAVRQIDSACSCSITIANQQSLVPAFASSGLARQVDRLQQATGQGPSLRNTATDAGAVHSADLAHDHRWPIFGAMAADHGAAALLSYRMLTRPRQVASLNIYAHHRYSFNEQDDHFARLLAGHLAQATDPTGSHADLSLDPADDDLLGQAQQVLRVNDGLTDRQAFYLLVKHAHRTGRKLMDIAAHLSFTGQLAR